MKKLLGTTLALAMLLPAGANAELLKNLKVTGKIDLQGTAARNVRDFQTNQKGDNSGATAATNGQDRIGDMQTRVLVSADWDLLDDVHARITLRKNDRVWGNSSQSLVTGALDAFHVDESFIKIDKLMGSLDTTLGRQFIGEEGDLVAYYGPRTNLYGMGVDALDAAKFDWANEHMGLTALTGKAAGNTGALGTAGSNHQDVRAIILGCKGHEMIQGKVYIWNQATHRNGVAGNVPVGTNPGAGVGAKNDNLYVAGVKVNVKAGPAWLKAEFDKNYGENRQALTATDHSDRKYTGWATLLNAGAKVEAGSLGMLTGWGEFGYGTGSSDGLSNINSGFTSINTDYRPGSLYGRFAQNTAGTSFADSLDGVVSGGSIAASNGLSNRVIKGVGVKLTPAAINKLTVALSAWDFHFAHTGRKGQGAGATPEIGGNGNRHIGNEFDLEFAWQHSENVLVKVGGASFQSGGWVKETQKINNITTGNNPAYMLTSDVSVRF